MTGPYRLIALALACLLPPAPLVSPVMAGWKDYLRKTAEKAKQRSGQRREVRTGTVSAVRGLEESAADETGSADYAGLEWLESVAVAESELRRFIREGRLAP
ncbi:MAG: hypothetical protein ABIJ96_04410 [Elusimicrobiota bacterium]